MPTKSLKHVSNIVISGATGLIGTALSQHLRSKGHHVRQLVRHRPRSDSRQEIYWNPDSHFIETDALEATDVLINLSGKNISDHRWSASQKKAIRDSRVQSTQLISHALTRLKKPPRLFISASAVGYYGDRAEETIDEESKPGLGFLAEVTRQWEAATIDAERAGIPVVHLRTGMVLDSHGGALQKMLPLFRLGLGGVIGSGQQFISWISLADVVGAIEHIISAEHFEGPVNLVSPNPVSNKTFSTVLAQILHRPCALNIPPFAIQLFLGQLGEELLLHGCKALPSKLIKSGYQFQQTHIEDAFRTLFKT